MGFGLCLQSHLLPPKQLSPGKELREAMSPSYRQLDWGTSDNEEGAWLKQRRLPIMASQDNCIPLPNSQ